MKQPQHNMSLPLSLPHAAPPTDLASSASPSPAQSALSITRNAIARWRGAPLPAGALARDQTRQSPQARWVAQAHAGLNTWIEQGGFAQPEQHGGPADLLAPLTRPVMYRLPTAPRSAAGTSPERACRLN